MKGTNIASHTFWTGKKVFLTGHTGFKGSWLSIWLTSMGALVTGYSLSPSSQPSLFEIAKIENIIEESITGDIKELGNLRNAIKKADPEIVIHMAAQPLVRASYMDPVETYSTNVMGTVNVMEAVRSCKKVKVLLNITTDKCYENKEWVWGYRENEPLGGHDPYSSSKACSEIITSAYRSSFFKDSHIQVATARAGNVIGGGDWAKDRLIPDVIKGLTEKKEIEIRNPNSIRPWQYVLEPLYGYLLLCEHMYAFGDRYSQAWNFGPHEEDAKPVEWIVSKMIAKWPYDHVGYRVAPSCELHEANLLKLDCSKAAKELNWTPKWSLEEALDRTVEWALAYLDGKDVIHTCEQQIKDYMYGS